MFCIQFVQQKQNDQINVTKEWQHLNTVGRVAIHHHDILALENLKN